MNTEGAHAVHAGLDLPTEMELWSYPGPSPCPRVQRAEVPEDGGTGVNRGLGWQRGHRLGCFLQSIWGEGLEGAPHLHPLWLTPVRWWRAYGEPWMAGGALMGTRGGQGSITVPALMSVAGDIHRKATPCLGNAQAQISKGPRGDSTGLVQNLGSLEETQCKAFVSVTMVAPKVTDQVPGWGQRVGSWEGQDSGFPLGLPASDLVDTSVPCSVPWWPQSCMKVTGTLGEV